MNNASNVMTAQLSISAILRAGKKLIDSPQKWTRGALARTTDSEQTYYSNPHACQFCTVGAILRIAFNLNLNSNSYDHAIATEFLDKAALELGAVNSCIDFNDYNHTHEQVMEMWDKAIAAAEAAERIKSDEFQEAMRNGDLPTDADPTLDDWNSSDGQGE